MIYILSPVGEATGGTELLQQFCAELRKQGAEAMMFYEEEYSGSAVEEKFAHYENPYCYEAIDDTSNLLIVPEVRTEVVKDFERIRKAVWWLSVDNYKGAFPQLRVHDSFPVRKVLRYIKHFPQTFVEKRAFKKMNHLVQSQYASGFLKSMGISENQIFKVSDYIGQSFQMPSRTDKKRQDEILYNPKKGWGFTRRLIREFPDRSWVPLSGLTTEEMISKMQTAKVYVDFGNHPGKDRVPREAAACGCCIVTGKAGSSCNDVDVPIPNTYKFDDRAKPETIMALVDDCLSDYDEKMRDFKSYRAMIAEEEDEFSQEVASFFAAQSEWK